MTPAAAKQERLTRYPGTHPFKDTVRDAAQFFGREEETAELYLRVLSVPLLVQFGKSGLGKTSLLQAGLSPRLRTQPFLPVLVRLNIETETLTQAVRRGIAESCAAEGLQDASSTAMGLWDLLSEVAVWRGDLLLTPILIFDQFEEVFTLRDAGFRAELAAQLGAIACGTPPPGHAPQNDAPPDAKIVISLREDYLGSLEEFSAAIPGLFQERLRLEPLRRSAARAAIADPARLEPPPGEPPYESPPFRFEEKTLDAMLDYLEGASGIIEPFQLQLLCQHAESVATGKFARGERDVTLSLSDFDGGRDFARVLDNFYRRTIGRISPASQRRKAAHLCEEGLIGKGGHRLMLEERQVLGDYKVTPKTLNTLCGERVVRREPRQESVFYEIAHDRVAEAIQAARGTKLPRRVRQVLWAAGLAVVVVVLALAGWNRGIRKERDLSRRSLARAESLISFLLGEQLLGELRDTGRSSLLELVQTRVDAGALAPVNQALAFRNRGDIERTRGKLAAAVASYRESLRLLTAASPGALRELARTHDQLGSALVDMGDLAAALSHRSQAADAWRAAIRGAGGSASSDDCVDLARALVETSFIRHRMGHADVALRDAESAVAVLSDTLFLPRGPGERCAPPARLSPHPDAKALEVLSEALSARAQILQATENFEASAALAREASALNPPSASARQRSFAAAAMAAAQDAAQDDTEDLARAAAALRKSLDDANVLLRWDPQNRLWQRERAAHQLLMVDSIVACVEAKADCGPNVSIDTAQAMTLEAIATIRALAKSDPASVTLRDDLVWGLQTYASTAAATGHHDAVLQAIREAESVLGDLPPDPFRIRDRGDLAFLKAGSLDAMGRRQEALEASRAAVATFRQLTARHPDHPLFLSSLADALEREIALLERSGNSAAAKALAEEAALVESQTSARDEGRNKRLVRLDDLDRQHYQKAVELAEKGDPAGAIRELEASEAAGREFIQAAPGYFGGYRDLHVTYNDMQMAQGKLADAGARHAAFRAATNAAYVAALLAPADQRESAHRNLLITRWNHFDVLVENGQHIDALTIGQETVVLAERLTQLNANEPVYDAALAGLLCKLGVMRSLMSQPGAQEAVQSGMIYAQRAAKANPELTSQVRACQSAIDIVGN